MMKKNSKTTFKKIEARGIIASGFCIVIIRCGKQTEILVMIFIVKFVEFLILTAVQIF